MQVKKFLRLAVTLLLWGCGQASHEQRLEQSGELGNINTDEIPAVTQISDGPYGETQAVTNPQTSNQDIPPPKEINIYDPFSSVSSDGSELQSTVIGNGKFPDEKTSLTVSPIMEIKSFCIVADDPVFAQSTAKIFMQVMQTWREYLLKSNAKNIPYRWLAMVYSEHCEWDTDFILIIGPSNPKFDSQISKAKKSLGKELLALGGNFKPKDSYRIKSFIYFDPMHLNGYQNDSSWLTVVLLREVGLLIGFNNTSGTIMEDRWQILINPKIWQRLNADLFLSIDQSKRLLPCPECTTP